VPGESASESDEVLEINRLTARGVVALIAEAPGLLVRMTRSSALLMSGENVPDLNLLLVGPDGEPEHFLNEAIETARGCGLPLVAAFTPHVARALAPCADRLGLTPAGTLPMMVLRAMAPIAPSRASKVEQVSNASQGAVAGDLQARAFDLPRQSIARVFDASRTEASPVETFIGSDGGAPSTTISFVRTGTSAGIWMMATDPMQQRRGAGRALLTQLLEQYRRAGVRRFYLNTSPAGRALYESVGFEVIAEYALYVLA
jgi:ribosomal protein S18 acetylase RimI-like enzyme